MNDAQYIGPDVHQGTISVSVLDGDGKLVMEAILETKAETPLRLMRGLRLPPGKLCDVPTLLAR